MKILKLEELGISPAPWKAVPYGLSTEDKHPTIGDVFDATGESITIDIPTYRDACMMGAAPELYKWLAYAVEQYKCETRACDNCPNGKCWIVDATAVLRKASGESEVVDG